MIHQGLPAHQIWGALPTAVGIVASTLIADCFGRRTTLVGTLAVLIAIFNAVILMLMDGGPEAEDIFINLGFGLIGLSYEESSNPLDFTAAQVTL